MRQIVGADCGLSLLQGAGRLAATSLDSLPAAGVGDAPAGAEADPGTDGAAPPGARGGPAGHAFSGARPEEMMALNFQLSAMV